MRRFLAVAATITLMMAITAEAQTDEPLADPDAIFAEGVTWTRVESELATRPQVNSESKTIEVFDGESWQTFPYPPDVEAVQGAALRHDGIVVIILSSLFHPQRPEDMWLLDPLTGDYTRPVAVCGGNVLAARHGEAGEWVVVQDEEEAFLCHSGTGEHLNILPEGLTGWRISPSPDGAYLVLAARDGKVRFMVYAYDLNTGTIVERGSVAGDHGIQLSFCHWLSDTHCLLSTYNTRHSWYWTTYYSFDVTQEDNLDRVFSGWDDNILWIDDPPRYVTLFSQNHATAISGGRGPDQIPCMLITYDAEQRRALEIGYECLPVTLNEMNTAPYLRHGDTIYYLTIQSADASIATLHSFDTRTLMQQEIFAGEIENVLSVSPDGHYVALLIDDNGKFDFEWLGLGWFCCLQAGGYTVSILDTETQKFVYRTELVGVYASSQIDWLDEHSVVIAAAQARDDLRVAGDDATISDIIPPSLRRITFNGDASTDVVITTRLGLGDDDDLVLNTSPDHRYWLRSDNIVVDLRNFQMIQILRDGIEGDHVPRLSWTSDSDLDVRMTIAGVSYHYRVTLLP